MTLLQGTCDLLGRLRLGIIALFAGRSAARFDCVGTTKGETMKLLRVAGISSVLVLCVGLALGQDASHDAGKAATTTGHAIKHSAKKAAHATKSGVKDAGHGAKVVAKDSAKGIKTASNRTGEAVKGTTTQEAPPK